MFVDFAFLAIWGVSEGETTISIVLFTLFITTEIGFGRSYFPETRGKQSQIHQETKIPIRNLAVSLCGFMREWEMQRWEGSFCLLWAARDGSSGKEIQHPTSQGCLSAKRSCKASVWISLTRGMKRRDGNIENAQQINSAMHPIRVSSLADGHQN